VPPPEGVRSARISSVRQGPKGPLIAFASVDDVASASQLRGLHVLASAEEVPEAEELEDVIGYSVTDALRGSLGVVSDLIVTGANDVWVVQGPYGEVLVPVIEQVVDVVDEEAREIRVRLLPGLLSDE
jgi:16S rRNA processing protein RimM